MIYLLLGIALVFVSMWVYKVETANTKLRRANDTLTAEKQVVVDALRDLEERAEVVVTQPAYFFLAGLFGNSVADEINLLDHSVLNGFISVKDYNSKVEALLQPYLDIPNV